MLARARSLSLTRRLIGQYLMFGCASILALAVCTLVVFPSLLRGDAAEDSLSRVQAFADVLVGDYAGGNGARIQSLVEQLGHEHWVAYCAVVSTDNVYLAHSKPRRIGDACAYSRPAADGKIHRIERIDWTRDDSGSPGADRLPVREYWVALKQDDRHFGTLQCGVLEQAGTDWWHKLLDYSPQAVLLSLSILLVGGRRLHKATVECAAIEKQLVLISGQSAESSSIRRLPELGRAAAGWNRLVDQAQSSRSSASLEASLARALGGMREQKAERILNSLADGIAVTDTDGSITFANQAFCTLLNTYSDKLRSGEVMELLQQFGLSFGDDVTDQLRCESRPAVFEGRRGSEIADGILRVARTPYVGDDGLAAGHIWTIRDVTQQKLADEMRTQFVNSATHELRTPLANIKAYAETLALNDITDLENQKEFLNIINSEATRLARFVDELLNAHAERGRSESAPADRAEAAVVRNRHSAKAAGTRNGQGQGDGGDREPAGQCCQIHSRRRPAGAARHLRERGTQDRGGRHGHRHRRRRAAEDRRQVLSQRRPARPRHSRQRAGIIPRSGSGAAARRQSLHPQRIEQGEPVHPDSARSVKELNHVRTP
jgi:PAS domain S-box-containing protein